MKHTLFRRHSFLAVASLLILAVMCAPLAFAAGAAVAASPGAAAAAPLGGKLATGGALLFGLGTALASDPKGDEEKPVSRDEAIKVMDDPTLPLMQRIKVMGRALRGMDETGQLAKIQGEYDRAMADLKTANEDKQKLTAEVDDLKKQLAAREKDVEAADQARVAAETEVKDLRSKEQDLDKRAEAKSKEKLGSLGFPSSQAPAASDKPTAADSLEDLRAKFKAEQDPKAKGLLARQIRQMEEKAAA